MPVVKRATSFFRGSTTNLNLQVSNLAVPGNIDPSHGAGPPSSSKDSPFTKQSDTVNIILFGETGVGKSSVINLIAQRRLAKVSLDSVMESTRYDISFDGMDYAIFDTVGLEEPEMGVNGYLKAVEKAFELITKLGAAGGPHLLLFCMRAGRITPTTQSNYRMFYELLCGKKIPIALVFTGLEREVEMEDYWTRMKTHIEHYGIRSQGHACVTAVPDELAKYNESQKKIRGLIKNCALQNPVALPELLPWYARVAKGMMSSIKKGSDPGRKKIVKVLTQRCCLAPDVAERIVGMMEGSDIEPDENETRRAGNEGGATKEKSGIAENAPKTYDPSSHHSNVGQHPFSTDRGAEQIPPSLVVPGNIEFSDEIGLASSGTPPPTPQPGSINIIVLGETGVGKSSVINLIAQQRLASVSSDVNSCTTESTPYSISFDDMHCTIFDTIGLEKPEMEDTGCLKAMEKAFELIAKLEDKADGVHLFLFCVRRGRIAVTTQRNYRRFSERLCDKEVPIALVFTGLEKEVDMEGWWIRNKGYIEHCGMKSQGHACITASHDDTPEEIAKYAESQQKIRELIKNCALKNAKSMTTENPLKHDAAKLEGSDAMTYAAGPVDVARSDRFPMDSSLNIILFGETGGTRSSVINLIAGSTIVETSQAVQGCAMSFEPYTFDVSGQHFHVWDTAGLEEHEMGVHRYLKVIEKAFELITRLEAAGGIHLLLFCVSGAEISATTQNNYRMFHEHLCNREVPMALVFTGLGGEADTEDWWARNRFRIERYTVESQGHTCVITAHDDTPEQLDKYTQSQKRIRELIQSCALKSAASLAEPHSWFVRFAKGTTDFIQKHPDPGEYMKASTQHRGLALDVTEEVVSMMEEGDSGPGQNETSQAGEREGKGGPDPPSILPPRVEKENQLDDAAAEQLEMGEDNADVKSEMISVEKSWHEAVVGKDGTTLKSPIIGAIKDLSITVGPEADNSSTQDVILVRGVSTDFDRVELAKDDGADNYTAQFEVNKEYIGRIIGAHGIDIINLRDRFNVKVDVSDEVENDSQKSRFKITGRKEKVDEAKKSILTQIERMTDETSEDLKILAQCNASLIGQDSKHTIHLEEKYGVKITFPRGGSENGENKTRQALEAEDVHIEGERSGVAGAQSKLLEVLEFEKESNNDLELTVPTCTVTRISGEGGASINKIKDDTGVQIDIDEAMSASDAVANITVRGTKKTTSAAKAAILTISEPVGKEASTSSVIPRQGELAAEVRLFGESSHVGDTKAELEKADSTLRDRVILAIETPAAQLPNFLIGREGQHMTDLQTRAGIPVQFPEIQSCNHVGEVDSSGEPRDSASPTDIAEVTEARSACEAATGELKGRIQKVPSPVELLITEESAPLNHRHAVSQQETKLHSSHGVQVKQSAHLQKPAALILPPRSVALPAWTDGVERDSLESDRQASPVYYDAKERESEWSLKVKDMASHSNIKVGIEQPEARAQIVESKDSNVAGLRAESGAGISVSRDNNSIVPVGSESAVKEVRELGCKQVALPERSGVQADQYTHLQKPAVENNNPGLNEIATKDAEEKKDGDGPNPPSTSPSLIEKENQPYRVAAEQPNMDEDNADVKSEWISVEKRWDEAVIGKDAFFCRIIDAAKDLSITVGPEADNSSTHDVISARGISADVDCTIRGVLPVVELAKNDGTDSNHTTQFEVNKEYVGQIIGAHGTDIINLRDRFNVRVDVSDEVENDSQKSRFKITGRKEKFDEAKKFILTEIERMTDETSEAFKIPVQIRASLIDENGENEVREALNVVEDLEGGKNDASPEFRAREFERESNVLEPNVSHAAACSPNRGSASINESTDDTVADININKATDDNDAVANITIRGTKEADTAAKSAVLAVPAPTDEDTSASPVMRVIVILQQRPFPANHDISRLEGELSDEIRRREDRVRNTEAELNKMDTTLIDRVVILAIEVPAAKHHNLIDRGGGRYLTDLQTRTGVQVLFPVFQSYNHAGEADNSSELRSAKPTDIVKVSGTRSACEAAISELKAFTVVESAPSRHYPVVSQQGTKLHPQVEQYAHLQKRAVLVHPLRSVTSPPRGDGAETESLESDWPVSPVYYDAEEGHSEWALQAKDAASHWRTQSGIRAGIEQAGARTRIVESKDSNVVGLHAESGAHIAISRDYNTTAPIGSNSTVKEAKEQIRDQVASPQRSGHC